MTKENGCTKREPPEFVNSHFLPPSHPPDVLGGNHSYSLPLITGALVRRGLGWGMLFMQKRDAPHHDGLWVLNYQELLLMKSLIASFTGIPF